MVTNLRIKLATIMLLALTLVAVSIPVVATVYQNGGDDTVKDCATAGTEDVCLPAPDAAIQSEAQLTCDEAADQACDTVDTADQACDTVGVADQECGDIGSVTCAPQAVECAQEVRVAASTCPATQNTCNTVNTSNASNACNKTHDTAAVGNASKACTANKTCSKAANATGCGLNTTVTEKKACSEVRTTDNICNGSAAAACPVTEQECEPAVQECEELVD